MFLSLYSDLFYHSTAKMTEPVTEGKARNQAVGRLSIHFDIFVLEHNISREKISFFRPKIA